MKQFVSITAMVVSALLVSSCSTKDVGGPNNPRATVFLRDGTNYTGAVKSTSPTEITLVGDDKNSRTFAMANVKSIEYGDTAPAAGSEPPRAHPDESVINTKTNVLAVGTHVSVRTDETIDSAKAVEGQTFAAEIAKDVRDAAG